MKVDLQEIEAAMLENKIDTTKVRAVIHQLEQVIEELKNDKDQIPKSKYEYVVILLDKDNVLEGKEFGAWVVQQEQDTDAGLIFGKITEAAKNQNEAQKRKRNYITDLTNLFEYLKPKFLKEKKVRIKTKDLTRVLITNGRL